MSLRYKGALLSATPPTTTGGESGTATGVWTMQQQFQAQGSSAWPLPPQPKYIEDVFSTYLYTGNGSTQTITNGIDLSGKGGMTWIKSRSAAYTGRIFDTTRGATKFLVPSATDAEDTNSSTLTAFTSSGFSVGASTAVGENGTTYASWTFRKQPKFFDIVTFTGPTSGNTITVNHNLGSTPGCIIYRSIESGDNWIVWHRNLATENYLKLESTTYAEDYNHAINATSTTFSLRASYNIGANLGNCIAYVFAHDAGGFGSNNDQSVISCGSYTGNGTTPGPSVNLGWEPQWVMIKRVGTSLSTGNWFIFDNMRGLTMDQEPYLYANTSDAEFSPSDFLDPIATGFNIKTSSSSINASGDTYIYIAIRRPMKTPTSGTEVYTSDYRTGGFVSGFPVDFALMKNLYTPNSADWQTGTRLIGTKKLATTSTAAETTDSNFTFTNMTGWYNGTPPTDNQSWMFKRAPGFFDVVCYTGTGSATTVTHNLGVAPELMIVRSRSATANWEVYAAPLGATKYLRLDLTSAAGTYTDFWNDTAPTSTVFTVGTDADVNGSGRTQVAYLFASCPGVSKVGSVNITGSTINVDCGFTSGARFVLLKRTSGTGPWLVWDTARGIVAGDDPYLALNSTAAQDFDGAADFIDPYSAGFTIAAGAIDGYWGAGDYIYLAIA